MEIQFNEDAFNHIVDQNGHLSDGSVTLRVVGTRAICDDWHSGQDPSYVGSHGDEVTFPKEALCDVYNAARVSAGEAAVTIEGTHRSWQRYSSIDTGSDLNTDFEWWATVLLRMRLGALHLLDVSYTDI